MKLDRPSLVGAVLCIALTILILQANILLSGAGIFRINDVLALVVASAWVAITIALDRRKPRR
jgi:hypothetical protein